AVRGRPPPAGPGRTPAGPRPGPGRPRRPGARWWPPGARPRGRARGGGRRPAAPPAGPGPRPAATQARQGRRRGGGSGATSFRLGERMAVSDDIGGNDSLLTPAGRAKSTDAGGLTLVKEGQAVALRLRLDAGRGGVSA